MESSPTLEYAAGFFPNDKDMLANRGTWVKWFESKKKINDINKCIAIDEWMNSSVTHEKDNSQSDDDMEVLPDEYESSFESVAECVSPQNKKQNSLKILRTENNVQSTPVYINDLPETQKLIKYYFDDIVKERVKIWQEKGIDRLLPPASKRKTNNSTKKVNDGFENYKFKGKLRIEEARTITYMCDSDSDSVDTAEYIRGARGKGNKSVGSKIKNRLIKQYAYAQKIQSTKTIEIDHKRKIMYKHFPLDDSGSSDALVEIKRNNKIKRNKSKNNNQHFPLDDRVESSSGNIKFKRKRSQRNTKLVNSKSHSGSSSENMFHRHPNRTNISRYINRWNRSQISSEETDNSDPDDKILDNVRKAHTKLVNSSNQPDVILNPLKCSSFALTQTPKELMIRSQPEQSVICDSTTRISNCPVIEYLPESEKQLVIYGSIKCVTNKEPIEETDNNDPHDKILDNEKKAHIKLVNSSNQPNVISNPSQCMSSELIKTTNVSVLISQQDQQFVNSFFESEKQLVLYGSINNVTNNDPIEIVSSNSEEDSEDDILFMSNKKRLRLYGKCFVEEPSNCQSVVLYNRGSIHQNDSDGSSTDDFLFKRKYYKPIL